MKKLSAANDNKGFKIDKKTGTVKIRIPGVKPGGFRKQWR